MTTNQEATEASERIDVNVDRPLDADEYEHRARYAWAATLLPQGEILDAACGTGHGSQLLAERSAVTGVDRDPAAIERATTRTPGTFVLAEIPPLPLPDASFDAVVSFETIEHLEQDAAFLQEAARVLRPSGTLLISTPNSDVSSPDGDPNNPYHVREYTLGEIRQLLETNGFQVLESFGQRSATRSSPQRLKRALAWRLRFLGRVSAMAHRFVYSKALDLDVRPMTEQDRPAFWILSCRKV